MDICTQIAQEMHIRVGQVQTTVKLLDEGNTIRLLPATAKRPPAAWTTPFCAIYTTGLPICAICKAPGRNCLLH